MKREIGDGRVAESRRQEGCHVERVEKPVDEEALNRSSVALLMVSGMGCPNCAMRVRNGLLRWPGVLRAVVSLEKGLAWVNFDSEQLPVDDLLDAVTEAGVESNHHYEAVLTDIVV